MHFSYTNHVVVQNIYIYIGRKEEDHYRTDGGIKKNQKNKYT